MKIVPEAQPVIFGSRNDLVGWYHGPAPTHARGLGVVICPPNGYENLCIHWALRLLAERLATEGIATVRVSYHGTGDALGDDRQPGRVPAWLESIGAAIELLKAKSGVRRVALLGVRLGAALAAAAAAQRTDVEALALYAPCLSGRTYVREQKALGLTRHPDDPLEDTGNPNDVLMAGWFISEETAAALGKLELSKLPRAPAREVLILHREDFPVDERPQKHLAALGVQVTAQRTRDWVAFMQDALTGALPQRDFDTLVRWLVERAGPPQQAAPVPAAPPLVTLLEGERFIEEPVLFSKHAMFGVLCTPKAAAPGAPLIVFLNTGASHHIGAHRSWVSMSRALAARGVATFRFDIGGLGDSPARAGRPQNGVYAMAATKDVAAALDFLESRGFHNFTLAGLCSGGFLAFNSAVIDRRVRALVMVNLQRFTWKDGDSLAIARRLSVASTDTYFRRALKLETWKRLARGSVNLKLIGTALAARGVKSLKARASGIASRVLGPAFEVNDVRRGFLQILLRGARVTLVYGESDGGLDEVTAHLGPDLKRLRKYPNAELVYLRDTDHTLTTTPAMAKLLELLQRVALQR